MKELTQSQVNKLIKRSMGMKKADSKLEFLEGRVWRITPNPTSKRTRRIRVPKRWSRR